MTVEIHEHPFDPWQIMSVYRSKNLVAGKSGASAVFVGTMRDFNEGDEVQEMVLDWVPSTPRCLRTIGRSAIQRPRDWHSP